MIGLKNRGSLPAITEDEFEHLVAQFRGLFLVEHNEDGTHITRDRELDFVPVGALQGWLTGTPPTGWVLLDGTQKNRLTYQGLFNLWGTTYGAGDGSTTFNLPDMRGRFFLGKAAAGTGSILGGTGGAIDHTHTGADHTHAISSGGAHVHTGPSHTHTLSGSTASIAPSLSGETGNQTSLTGTSSHNTSTTAYTVDAGTAQNIVRRIGSFDPPTSEGHSHILNNHHHALGTLAVDSHAHGIGSIVAANSGIGNTSSDGAHDHGGVTGSGGTGTTGTNNPPFLAGHWIAFSGVA